MTKKLSHFDQTGRAQMVDVGNKTPTQRLAVAKGQVRISPELAQILIEGKLEKGDAFTVAKTAAILAAKKTGELIPMCHPLGLDQVSVEMTLDQKHGLVLIQATAKLTGKTGVEMEALMAVSMAALTFYDMCKAVDKKMIIEGICLVRKEGGKSGTFINDPL